MTDGKTKRRQNPPNLPPLRRNNRADRRIAGEFIRAAENEEDVDLSQHTMHNLSLSDLNVEIPELATAVPNSAAAPQPNISEEFIVKPVANEAPTEKKQRSETMRLFFAALGVLAMLSFAAGFLALVYYLFFYKAAE
jgi:hypothetical protein